MDEETTGLTAAFMFSAGRYRDIPESKATEFCVLGRSNVGKSSFINHLFRNKSLARVSKTPGRTTLINVYRVSDGSVWADMPGYGYAHRSFAEKKRFGRLVEEYCGKRPNLAGVIWLCDIRHPGQVIDIQAYEWLESLATAILPVLTKADKLSKNEQRKNMREYSLHFCFDHAPVLYSIHQEESRQAFLCAYAAWSKNAAGQGGIVA